LARFHRTKRTKFCHPELLAELARLVANSSYGAATHIYGGAPLPDSVEQSFLLLLKSLKVYFLFTRLRAPTFEDCRIFDVARQIIIASFIFNNFPVTPTFHYD
jgi:hypothetical protein